MLFEGRQGPSPLVHRDEVLRLPRARGCVAPALLEGPLLLGRHRLGPRLVRLRVALLQPWGGVEEDQHDRGVILEGVPARAGGPQLLHAARVHDGDRVEGVELREGLSEGVGVAREGLLGGLLRRPSEDLEDPLPHQLLLVRGGGQSGRPTSLGLGGLGKGAELHRGHYRLDVALASERRTKVLEQEPGAMS